MIKFTAFYDNDFTRSHWPGKFQDSSQELEGGKLHCSTDRKTAHLSISLKAQTKSFSGIIFSIKS